ncbi:MAG: DMT family transporter [Pseudomonadota bacterium]
MRLFLLTALTMTAFAANSVLNRMAVGPGDADPASFAAIRTGAGASLLCILVLLRGGSLPVLHRDRVLGAGALALYMVGFSTAYLSLDAGLGALLLFGVVQIVMFCWNAFTGQPPKPVQLAGAGVAFAGLVIVLWPGPTAQVSAAGAALMIAAGVGWAIYTLAGRSATDPLATTAGNFFWCLPLTAIALAFAPELAITSRGLALAVLSGAVTSGLGYALWYQIIPALGPSRAAVVQLSVPVIAIAAGAVLLAEPAGLRLLLGTVFVLGGIALALRGK